MLLWSISGVPFGVYAIAQQFNIPLIVQPQCFCVLCGVSWAQCLIYGRKWRTWTASLLLLVLLAIFAGTEAGLVFAIRPPYSRGLDWPVLLVGIIAFLTLISGYMPIPFELLKRRGRVVGIDFIFLAIDWNGAFFSLMALVTQHEFDVLFGTMYALCCAIEMSMVASHLTWRLRTRGIRKRAKESGKTFEEFEEGIEWQAKGIDLGKLLKRLTAGKTCEGTSGAASVDVEALPIPEEVTPKTVPDAAV
ncbi:PQ loop repeat protein [Stemphylium lycopersici]|uniref:PQ loop repeat protein n=1 Tax=Stemphylium lycopersici TaxID=183478 RepID=A0A364NC11_STELY|nr:PQ loop repeat protein [Stemphylium lycopersici]RAR14591.1 PQ loop repeat protein [Stemphylium lycopersici]